MSILLNKLHTRFSTGILYRTRPAGSFEVGGHAPIIKWVRCKLEVLYNEFRPQLLCTGATLVIHRVLSRFGRSRMQGPIVVTGVNFLVS